MTDNNATSQAQSRVIALYERHLRVLQQEIKAARKEHRCNSELVSYLRGYLDGLMNNVPLKEEKDA